MNKWIGNGKVVFENSICETGSVLIENGIITEINKSCPNGVEKIDANGAYILPGFIDLHVHGGGNSDFMDATVEDILQVAKAHAKHGTTALFATTMTCEDAVLEKVITAFNHAKKVQTSGAELLGLHLEGPYFASKGKGAQPVQEQRLPERSVLEHFIALGEGNIKRWDEAPELPNTDVFAEVMKENRILASIAHTGAVADQANAAFEMGFSHITHFYSMTTTGQKINGVVYSGVNEATYLNDNITIEVIGDGKHIPKEHMLLAYKIKGADKMALITDAMRAAGTNNKNSVLGARDTGVDVVVKDGVAQLPDLSFYAGSVATMDRVLRVAHLEYGIPLVDTVKMLSLTPAKITKCDNRKGSIALGKDADVVIMDNEFKVINVFVKGQACYN